MDDLTVATGSGGGSRDGILVRRSEGRRRARANRVATAEIPDVTLPSGDRTLPGASASARSRTHDWPLGLSTGGSECQAAEPQWDVSPAVIAIASCDRRGETMTNSTDLFLITGATGRTGARTGGLLRERGLRVRAFVHTLDDRSTPLPEQGAQGL